MENMWDVDLELLRSLICVVGHMFEKILSLRKLCLFVDLKRIYSFSFQYLQGNGSIGNETHKLVTEVVPNPKKSNYIQKYFTLWFKYYLTDKKTTNQTFLRKPKTIFRTKMPVINWINTKIWSVKTTKWKMLRWKNKAI